MRGGFLHVAQRDSGVQRGGDERMAIVGGLVLLGDSALHTNPTAGRGVSLAFAQAQHLATTLDQATEPLSYAATFDAWTDTNIGAWYEPQAQADASLARHMQAAVDGKPSPPPDPMERLRLAIFKASRTDAQVALPLRRMIHLVSLPRDVIGNEAVRAALNALLAAHPELAARAEGPRRDEIAAARVAIGSLARSGGTRPGSRRTTKPRA